MRGLAVSAPRRLEGLYAGVPTWHERRVDCVVGAWRGISGPGGLAQEHVDFWEKTLARAVGTPEWKADLARLYWTDAYLDGAALRQHLPREREEMAADLGQLGLLRD
jgi:putative tricarboxylic transport membrane protein